MGVIEAWWNKRKLELPQDAAGLWFGIVELAKPPERQWMLYVAACPTFDLSDADAEWATEYISFPLSRDHYLPLRDLGIEVSGDWRGTLEAVAAAVRLLQPESFGAVQRVAVGYDDGDLTAWTR